MTNQIENQITNSAKIIANSKHLIVFTGAGISTASGLPDYRGPEGVWTLRDKGIKPKPLSKPMNEFEPNSAHKAVLELQNMSLLKLLISQNVDGLHVKSGIKIELIAELHGNTTLMKCLNCDARFSKTEIGWDESKFGRGYRKEGIKEGQPACLKCKGRIISSIVNFGDPMPEKESEESHIQSQQSDVFLVIGSTLTVQPAANYPWIAKNKGASLIIINKGETALDHLADIRIEGDCSEILPKIVNLVKEFKKLTN